jgi:hypothetical protein
VVEDRARCVRNAVQLTVAELAAVESHPCSHPQWVSGSILL